MCCLPVRYTGTVCIYIYVNHVPHAFGLPLPLTAFPSAPILSADEQLLYISGASATIFCVSALTGNFIWTVETGGIHRTEPVLSEIEGEDSVVYFIQVRP
jgi:outer membrane protein assembly factor BamB